MNEPELVERLAVKLGLPKYKTKALVRGVFEEMRVALSKGEEVMIMNYVSFKILTVPQRTRTDPRGGVKVMPSQNRLLARPGHKMKQAVGQRVRQRGKYTEPYISRKGKAVGTKGSDLGYEER